MLIAACPHKTLGSNQYFVPAFLPICSGMNSSSGNDLKFIDGSE